MKTLKDKEHKNMHRWEDNIKMEFNKTRRVRVDCILLTLARDQLVGSCKHENKLQISLIVRNF
jgi:hypothetical protein